MPDRTCVGCRVREDKADLLRLVVTDGAIVVDHRQTRPGRGAYLHPRPECWETAIRKRALGRALRSPGVDTEQLPEQLRATLADAGPA